MTYYLSGEIGSLWRISIVAYLSRAYALNFTGVNKMGEVYERSRATFHLSSLFYARENYVTVESALLLGYGFEPKIS